MPLPLVVAGGIGLGIAAAFCLAGPCELGSAAAGAAATAAAVKNMLDGSGDHDPEDLFNQGAGYIVNAGEDTVRKLEQGRDWFPKFTIGMIVTAILARLISGGSLEDEGPLPLPQPKMKHPVVGPQP